jgi:zinc protease
MKLLARLFSVLLLSLAGLAVAPAALAQALPAGMTRITSVEGITEYRLANGLQILLVPDDSKPTTTVNLTYRVGSRHESYGETGMAHLLEHLIFKGTPTTRNALAEFGKRGLRANGTTSFDRTNYFASFAANDDNLRWFLSWHADAMVNSFIARADLDTEMTVVRNEMERGENDPGRILLQQTMATMFHWHNYGKSTIGARTDVENVSIERLQAFYRKHYQPDNATLIVAGRFDPTQVLAWTAKYFGAIPAPKRTLEPTYTLEPAQDGERTVTLRRSGGVPIIYVAFHTPPGAGEDAAALTILSWLIGDPPAGRLHRRLVERQLAASTFGFTWSLAEPGVMVLGAQLAPGQDVDKARSEMLAGIDSVFSEAITKEEFERARTQWLNYWEQGFNDPERVGVQLSDAVGQGDWRLFFIERDQMRALTLEGVQAAAGRWLKRDNRTVGIYLPTEQPERAPAPQRVDVAALVKDYRGDTAMAAVEGFDPTPANLDARTQTFVLASGMKVALRPTGARGGVVPARLRLHYGDLASLNGQTAVASFVARLIDKGGAGLSRSQISDRFDQLRAEVNIAPAGEQSVGVQVSTVRENLPAVIELLGRLLKDPAFSAEALDEQRAQWLTTLEGQRKEPGAVAANALARHGNPYPRGDLRHAPTFDEMELDTRAVTPEQLRGFHHRFYSAATSEFAAVGDIDPAAVRKALEAAFGDWRQPAAGALPYVRAPRPLIGMPPLRVLLNTPDKQNANLELVLPLAMNDDHPDFAAMLMANEMFGASASSRLWMRIRETDGLSYDVRSQIDWSPFEANSPWLASAIFAPQNQPRVEAAFREETLRVLKDGFSQAELDNQRAGLLASRRLGRAQDAAVAGRLVSNLHLGRRFERAQRLDDALAKLTPEQVNAAFRKHIDPARWAAAWGGDFKAP